MGFFGKALNTVMDTLFANKNKKFVDAHRVPAAKEPLLGCGAVLTYTNQHPPQVLLALDNPKLPAPADILNSVNLFNNAAETREAIAWVLAKGDRAELDPALLAHKSGQSDALKPAQKKMLAHVLEIMADPARRSDNMPEINKEYIAAVKTTLAWDMERAAFWARMAFNAGYMPESEAWDVLGKAHAEVKGSFARWSAYLVSFMLGRALIMTNSEHEESMADLWSNGVLMEAEGWGEIWLWHPLRR